jgi:hypothetical protein
MEGFDLERGKKIRKIEQRQFKTSETFTTLLNWDVVVDMNRRSAEV